MYENKLFPNDISEAVERAVIKAAREKELHRKHRKEREKHIQRKEGILRGHQNDSRPHFLDAKDITFSILDLENPGTTGYWMPFCAVKHRGMLSKGKIHCSCPMCRAKTRNKGSRRKGSLSPAHNYTIADQRKLDAMAADIRDYFIGEPDIVPAP